MRRTIVVVIAAAASLTLPSRADAASSGAVTSTVPIADQISVRATNISTAEAASINGPIATFTDSNAARPVSAFTATVTWGDGAATPGTVSRASGSFSVTASHVYADEGSYAMIVRVTQSPDGSEASGRGTVTISDTDTLSGMAVAVSPSDGQTFNGQVATFTDPNSSNVAADFSAGINWGDGARSVGVVNGANGSFTVRGMHTYKEGGNTSSRSGSRITPQERQPPRPKGKSASPTMG